MKKWFLITLAVLVISCKSDNKKSNVDTSQFVAHKVHDFSVETPKYMKSSHDLNPDASLQMENRNQEVYLAVIEEPKKEVIENFKLTGVYNDDLSPVANYLNVQMNGFSQGLQILEKSDPEEETINGLPALHVEMVAQPEEVAVGIYYLFTFIEGEDTLYMFMQWTVAQQKEEYQDTFEAVIETFEEVN